MRRFIVILGLLCLAGVVLAATTYTAPTPMTSRTSWQTNRYATPVQGLMTVLVDTTTQSDQTVTLDPNLSGYLDRVTITHDGNDASWKLYVKDTDGLALFSCTDLKASNDPCSYIVSYPSTAGTYYGGVPFVGGLTVQIADANTTGLTATAIHVKLYVREAWRR